MIVTHGWPGSFIEQMKIIERLTNPTAHGGTAVDAFQREINSVSIQLVLYAFGALENFALTIQTAVHGTCRAATNTR
jgi:hypothetical protein